MAQPEGLPNYDPKAIEEKWYRFWEEHNLFHAAAGTDHPPYTIVIPPPNVTGSLHMGHALNNTMQDIMIRYKRMQGYSSLWMPGTDHAGIATQYVVEKSLAEKGLNRRDLGREEFIKKVWEWRRQYGGTIINQLKRLGSSCDWERERFTMDEGLSRAVREVFVSLYEQGLIYRDHYIINWCPRCHTALSDLEVLYEEEEGRLYYIDYPLAEGKNAVTVATTRPETMLGDTAVAVNPEDPRMAAFVGKKVILPLANREIPVIGDTYVDIEFGTGALKITPAHDINDFEIGLRHKLPVIKVIDGEGRMTEEAGKYKGLDRNACREAVNEDLRQQGLMIKEEKYVHKVGHCYRCRDVVEPFLSRQWFVRMKPLAEPAIAAVAEGRTRFVPKSWEKTYFEWMNNIRDWCISRQIWWGHRIPAWTCSACGELTVSREDPKECPKCKGKDLNQETDVLDTWFSSALWPFSTMGWPENTPELKKFYPTSVLITAFDIIFFWVARMMMMGLKFMGEVPFKDVYIHALVLDEKGQKMSKSKGNVIDPLVIIDQFGADAFRYTLAALAAQGRNIRLSESRIEGYRFFANKIWNAARFALMHIPAGEDGAPKPENFQPSLADRWIRSRLQQTVGGVCQALDEYRFNEAAHLIYQFTWHEFCDWYIELSKPALEGKTGENAAAHARYVLIDTLKNILKLLHPFIPFISEELWQRLRGGKPTTPESSLIIQPFPKADTALQDKEAEQQMALLQEVIIAIRNLRSEMKVSPGERVEVALILEEAKAMDFLESRRADISLLARVEKLSVFKEKRSFSQAVTAVTGPVEVHLLLKELPDIAAEMKTLNKSLAKIEKDMETSEKKLNNDSFLKQAPPEVVEKEKEKLEENRSKLEKTREHINRLKKLSGV